MLVAEAAFKLWMRACITVAVVDATTAIADLHASWMDWSRGGNYEPVSKRQLGRLLTRHRFERCRLLGGVRAHRGLALIGADEVLRTVDDTEVRAAVGDWIKDCCARGRGVVATVGELYESWSAWAEAAGEFAGKRAFCRALAARGYRRCRRHGGVRAHCGLRLKAARRDQL